MTDVRAEIRELLAEDRVRDALLRLREIASSQPESPEQSSVILLQGRHTRLLRGEIDGTADPRARNELRASILALVESLPAANARREPQRQGAFPARSSPLEKIIGANRLFPLAWMRRGIEVARSVGKLIVGRETGTGFLIADGWVITNHHVLGSEGDCTRAKLLMNFEEELDGTYAQTVSYELIAETYRGSNPFDCAAVRVRDRPDAPLERWGVARFARTAARLGDFVSIIQHPGGVQRRSR